MKLYDELAGMAECVPLQRKHFNDEKGEHCFSVKYRLIGIFFTSKSGLILQFLSSYVVIFSGLAGPGSDSQSDPDPSRPKLSPQKEKMKKYHVLIVICLLGYNLLLEPGCAP